MIALSILICHTPSQKWRVPLLNALLFDLNAQRVNELDSVEVLIDHREGISIGEKRNKLLYDAQGYSVAFIDDDDSVSPNYLKETLAGMKRGADCCSLRGVITDDGRNPRIFEHSVRHNAYETVNPDLNQGVTYLRYPNHLNCIKSDIAKKFIFPETNHGEDTDWATQIHKSGLLNTEHWIEDVIYFYDHRTIK